MVSRENAHPPGVREPRRSTGLPWAALAAATVLLGVIVASDCWGADGIRGERKMPRIERSVR